MNKFITCITLILLAYTSFAQESMGKGIKQEKAKDLLDQVSAKFKSLIVR